MNKSNVAIEDTIDKAIQSINTPTTLQSKIITPEEDVDITKKNDYNNYTTERKKEPSNYVYKKITNEDRARVDSDYTLNKSKYIEENFVHFDDVSYGYRIENGKVEVTSKFKGSQKFIKEVEEAWENGVDKLSNGNTKITESIRSIKRESSTGNGISRKQSTSRKSNRESIGNGRQQRGVDSTKTSENNGNNLKNSKQSSFSLSENNQNETLFNERQKYNFDNVKRETYSKEDTEELKDPIYYKLNDKFERQKRNVELRRVRRKVCVN